EDGRLIAAGLQGKLRMYDPVLATVSSESDLPIPARSFRMSSDGHRMIIIPTNTKPRPPVLWDLDRDRVIAQLEGSKVQVFSARFIRGDREILTAGGDGVARRWDGETGRLLQSYRGSPKFLLDAVLAPDGATVVTGGGDGMLRFWDAASGALLWALQAHRSAVAGVHFEGAELVSRGFTGEISRWGLPKLTEASRVEELVRCLPLHFSERTGGLVDQAPCDTPPARSD
ncbi:MAG TPA: hypothetical protein VFK02_08420, partial [Kofleriaceae bacterium]|nr:hypothetical protein [Kofleriaceae bacterium]